VPAAKEQFTCSHQGCQAKLPGSYRGAEIPPGWTVGRIEEHRKTTIVLYYIYLCPLHTLASMERQTSLPFTTPVLEPTP
jgi:hypothetical protein